MASQGKCLKCKVHYIFCIDGNIFYNHWRKLNTIQCPACGNTLHATTHTNRLTKISFNPSTGKILNDPIIDDKIRDYYLMQERRGVYNVTK